MPLRDHFRPPVSKKSSWEGFHAMWPTCIVQQLRKELPDGYVAEPRVHLGTMMEVESKPPDEYEYEVRIYDVKHERKMVAAIEFVSPANKGRPESRDVFVSKCVALLRKGVAVSIVDLVTNRGFNLYGQSMALLGHPDPAMTAEEPPTYAATCRWLTIGARPRLEAWSYIMTVGQPLPTLPLWLADSLVVPLDLEPGYEHACHDLWIT